MGFATNSVRSVAIVLLVIFAFPTIALSIINTPLQTLWEAIKIRSDAANFTPSLVFVRHDDGAILDPNSHRWQLNRDVYEVQFEKFGEQSPVLDRLANAFGTWSYGFGTSPGETDVLGFGAAEYKRNLQSGGGDDITEVGGRFGAVELFGESGLLEPLTGFVLYKHGDERFDPPSSTLPGLPFPFNDLPSGQHALIIGDNGHPAKIRWTAPETMTVSISGTFRRPLETSVRVMIIKNDTEILFQPDPNTEGMMESQDAIFNLETSVDDGDTIDFTLAEALNSGENATAIDANVQVTQFDLEGCGGEEELPCTWFPDGFGGDTGSGWTTSGNVGFTADFPIPTEDASYDIQLEIKTGPSQSPGNMYTVNFKPGGAYSISTSERIVSFDDTDAANGHVDIVVDTSSGEIPFPDHQFVYLGRFEFEAGSGSVTIDAERSLVVEEQPTITHTPVSVWVAKAGESPASLTYNDLNSVPGGWLHPDTTQFPHYWGNVTNQESVFRFAQFFPLPAEDRLGLSADGIFDVRFSHFVIWHPQPAQIPVTVYFKPGGEFEEPDIDFDQGGFITDVDTSFADEGRVTIEITYPTTIFTCQDPDTGLPIGCESYPENAFSLGRYEFDDTAMYGVKLNSTPTQVPGSNSITAEQVTLVPIGGLPFFRRGDWDGSGLVDITDSLNRLGFLFLGTTLTNCSDAGDFDNSGAIDISDSLNELGFLFLGAVTPPLPGVDSCGQDPQEVLPPGGGLPEQPDFQLGCDCYDCNDPNACADL
jgi:hypothetical protein